MDISSHLNNLGAAAAEEGRFNQAVDLLGKALDAKLATLAISDSGKSTQSRFVQASGLIQARASRNGKKNHESSFQSDFTSSGTFIYRRAFFIEIEERDEEDSVTRINNTTTVPPLCIIHSAILLYNLALIYHMKAGPKKHIHFLEKSSTLYRMALGLVKDVADSQSINLVDSRLVLAILNNLGEIYFEQGESMLANRCFSNLSSVLSCMCASGRTSLVDRSDWSGFLLNAMMKNDPRSAAAA